MLDLELTWDIEHYLACSISWDLYTNWQPQFVWISRKYNFSQIGKFGLDIKRVGGWYVGKNLFSTGWELKTNLCKSFQDRIRLSKLK